MRYWPASKLLPHLPANAGVQVRDWALGKLPPAYLVDFMARAMDATPSINAPDFGYALDDSGRPHFRLTGYPSGIEWHALERIGVMTDGTAIVVTIHPLC